MGVCSLLLPPVTPPPPAVAAAEAASDRFFWTACRCATMRSCSWRAIGLGSGSGIGIGLGLGLGLGTPILTLTLTSDMVKVAVCQCTATSVVPRASSPPAEGGAALWDPSEMAPRAWLGAAVVVGARPRTWRAC